MYVPPSFAVADRGWSLDLIERYPFGLLVSSGDAYPQITHLPMLAQERDAELYIVGHVARANPHADAIFSGAAATAVFSGAHAFVSAFWYEAPYETVPTWNYSTVHASGRLRESGARSVLEAIVARFEGVDAGAWRLDGLRESYFEKQLRGIVAFEMRVERLAGKAKLSQNRTDSDRERVVAQLARSSDPVDRTTADDMRGALHVDER